MTIAIQSILALRRSKHPEYDRIAKLVQDQRSFSDICLKPSSHMPLHRSWNEPTLLGTQFGTAYKLEAV